MPIKIEITDLETIAPKTLLNLASLLRGFAGVHELPAPVVEHHAVLVPGPQFTEQEVAESKELAAAPIPTAPSINTAAFADVDANGLPWDGRIHSRTKAKNADGTWRTRRGANPSDVGRIEGELKQGQAAPAAVVPPPPPAAAPLVYAVPTFPDLMKVIAAGKQGPGFTMAEVVEVCVANGVPNLPVLASRPDLIPQVYDVFAARLPK